MSNKPFIIGQRYNLPHGTGIYIGYEGFTNNGYNSILIKIALSDPSSNVRRVFNLDPGHSWGFRSIYYCAWKKDIKPYVGI